MLKVERNEQHTLLILPGPSPRELIGTRRVMHAVV